MDMFDKLKDQANQNPDQVRDAVEKGGDFIDEKTGNKYAEHVDKAQDFITDRVAGGNEAPQGQPDSPRDNI